MNLQLLYWYILSLSKNKNMCYKKKTKQNKTKRPKKEEKKSGGTRISKPTNKNNSCHNLHVKVLDFVLFTIRT